MDTTAKVDDVLTDAVEEGELEYMPEIDEFPHGWYSIYTRHLFMTTGRRYPRDPPKAAAEPKPVCMAPRASITRVRATRRAAARKRSAAPT